MGHYSLKRQSVAQQSPVDSLLHQLSQQPTLLVVNDGGHQGSRQDRINSFACIKVDKAS
jgi:hypothetical protein